MIVRTIRVSSKGQFTIPVDVLRALNLRKGAELLLVQDGKSVVLVPAGVVGQRVIEELGGWEHLAAPAFEELWSNEADEVWNEA